MLTTVWSKAVRSIARARPRIRLPDPPAFCEGKNSNLALHWLNYTSMGGFLRLIVALGNLAVLHVSFGTTRPLLGSVAVRAVRTALCGKFIKYFSAVTGSSGR